MSRNDSSYKLITLPCTLIAMVLVFGQVAFAQGDGIDGFTEPFQKIDLASDESGAIDRLEVRAGDFVKQGSIIARLDDRAQQLQVRVATHMAKSESQILAATHALSKRESILRQLRKLKAKGHATESELIRADLELSIAKAKLMSVKEEKVVREIEKLRAEVQLDRRLIRAPFDGVVAKVHRRQGEFLSPLNPEIVTLVQVDRIFAKFSVPSSQVSMFEIGREFEVSIGNGKIVTGRVHEVGVEIDARSSTVEIKLVIDNVDNAIKSGEHCTLRI